MFQVQPGGAKFYYHKDKGEFRSGTGYSVWSIEDWHARFGHGANTIFFGKAAVDSNGRHWEFFGYTIPLYDEGDTS